MSSGIVLLLLLFIAYIHSINFPITYKHFSKSTEDKSSNYKENNFHVSYPFPLPTINICLGSPTVCVDLIIDSFGYMGWIATQSVPSPHQFNTLKAETLIQNSLTDYTFDYKLFKVIGRASKDLFWLDKKIIGGVNDFTFFAAHEPHDYQLNVDGIIGLSRELIYKLSNEQGESLIEYLFKRSVIKKRLFSIIHNKKNNTSALFLGEIPSVFNFKSGQRCHALIPMNEEDKWWMNNYWNCQLDQIIMKSKNGNKYFNIEKPVFFKTGRNAIFLPKVQESLLMAILDKAKQFGNNCILEEANTEKFVSCDLFDITLMGSIEFILDRTNLIQLMGKDMFTVSENNFNRMKSVFRVLNDTRYIIIGNALLKNYNTVFDLERGTIYFDSSNEEQIKNIPNKLISLKNILYLSIILISIMCIIWMLYVYRKINKENLIISK